jgi:hypothetical protein
VLLERGCDCGFARGGEAREPDCEAFLLAGGVALGAREGRVPCDVAARGGMLVRFGEGGGIGYLRCHVDGCVMKWGRCDE